MISFKYALDFEGFKQDVEDKNLLNVTFAGVEQPFARYDINEFKWGLQPGVPNSEAFYSEVAMVTSFSGCASVASRIIKEKVIVDEIALGLKVVEEFFLTLKTDYRMFFELNNDLGKEINSMSGLLKSLFAKSEASEYILSQVEVSSNKVKDLIDYLNEPSISFDKVSAHYSDN